MLWEASDRVCGKRLKPLLPLLVSALERHGHLTLGITVRDTIPTPAPVPTTKPVLVPDTSARLRIATPSGRVSIEESSGQE